MKDIEPSWRRNASRLVSGLLILFLISVGVQKIRKDFTLLTTAQSDNLQWNVMQAEVEFRRFETELLKFALGLSETGDNVRLAFDILFNRLGVLSQGSSYKALSDYEGFDNRLTSLQEFLDVTLPLVESNDELLRQWALELSIQASSIAPEFRRLGVDLLVGLSRTTDQRRREFVASIFTVAIAILVLVGGLIVSIVSLRRAQKIATEQKQTAQLAKNRLDVIFRTALDAIIVADEDGNIRDRNPAAEEMFGHKFDVDSDRLTGLSKFLNYQSELSPSEPAQVQLARFIASMGEGPKKMDLRRASDEKFPAEIMIQHAEYERGKMSIIFVRDISAQARAENAIVAARDAAILSDKLKTQFLATMSHEIRNPLNGLLGNLSLLKETETDEVQDRYIESMATSGMLLHQHVSDVLDLTRLQTSQAEIDSSPVDLRQLLNDVVTSFHGMAEKSRTEVSLKWDTACPDVVHTDSGLVRSIFMNLVGNALKFTPNGRVVIEVDCVASESDEAEYIFRVSDTGRGIPPDILPRIFEPFVSANTSYKREYGGTGLGLSITKRSVEVLGGSIAIIRKVRGTTFEVRLPMRPSSIQPNTAVINERNVEVSPLHILIVEDNQINQDVLFQMLNREGHKVSVVDNGRDAVILAYDEMFDLILMDISMPKMDGREATRAIRTGNGASSKARIIAVTANALKSEKAAFLQDGMDDVIIKPISREMLLATVSATDDETKPSLRTQHSFRAHLDEIKEVMGSEGYDSLSKRFSQQAERLNQTFNKPPLPDLQMVAAECHNLAGVALMLGFSRYGRLLGHIERAAKTGNSATVKRLILQLEKSWELDKALLETL